MKGFDSSRMFSVKRSVVQMFFFFFFLINRDVRGKARNSSSHVLRHVHGTMHARDFECCERTRLFVSSSTAFQLNCTGSSRELESFTDRSCDVFTMIPGLHVDIGDFFIGTGGHVRN